MLLAPRHHSTLASLLRLVSGWLAAVLLVQGLAAVQLQAAGPLHHHRGPPVVASASAAVLALLEHTHPHSADQRHNHHAADGSVVPAADAAALDEALAAAAAALVAAFAVLATCSALRLPGQAGRVWRAHVAWASLAGPVAPLLKPPQRA
jgi:hypothetical protein